MVSWLEMRRRARWGERGIVPVNDEPFLRFVCHMNDVLPSNVPVVDRIWFRVQNLAHI